MVIWICVLFFLGVAALIDTVYNFGEVFRQVNAVFFLLLSVGLLVRTLALRKRGRLENYRARVEKLEREIKSMANQRTPIDF